MWFIFSRIKRKCRRPIGIYLGCPKAGSEDGGKKALYRREGMLASDEHVKKCIELGADFIVLGGNPGSGTSIRDVVETAKKLNKNIKIKSLFLQENGKMVLMKKF